MTPERAFQSMQIKLEPKETMGARQSQAFAEHSKSRLPQISWGNMFWAHWMLQNWGREFPASLGANHRPVDAPDFLSKRAFDDWSTREWLCARTILFACIQGTELLLIMELKWSKNRL